MQFVSLKSIVRINKENVIIDRLLKMPKEWERLTHRLITETKTLNSQSFYLCLYLSLYTASEQK